MILKGVSFQKFKKRNKNLVSSVTFQIQNLHHFHGVKIKPTLFRASRYHPAPTTPTSDRIHRRGACMCGYTTSVYIPERPITFVRLLSRPITFVCLFARPITSVINLKKSSGETRCYVRERTGAGRRPYQQQKPAVDAGGLGVTRGGEEESS